MNLSPRQSLAVLSLRLIALVLVLIGAGQAVASILESYRDFDPSYLDHFFLTHLLRPCLAIVFGKLVWVFSRPLGIFLARGLG